MSILNDEIKSYNLIYEGAKENLVNDFLLNNITQYIFLNDLLVVIYVNSDFKEDVFDNMNQVVWWEDADEMSSLIEITNNIDEGESARLSIDLSYLEDDFYSNLTGEGVVVALIDSGIDYLNPDFIREDGSSKILYLWDQESDYKNPPDNMLFGSEFTREDINEAIRNNNSNLSNDEVGTGTLAAGLIASEGSNNINYRGISPDVDLIVVKLRSYTSLYREDRINYNSTDFLVAIAYILEKIREISKTVVVNFTVGARSGKRSVYNLLNTFEQLYGEGVILVSGAGNQGNTDIHYSGQILNKESKDVTFQVEDDKNLKITVNASSVDKLAIAIISPFGEISNTVFYNPAFNKVEGNFNLENASYTILYSYPWLFTGSLEVFIDLKNISSGIWTLRVIGEYIVNGNFDVYLPNKNLISENTRFIDSESSGTITRYGLTKEVITVGTYDARNNSIWVGSSKGSYEVLDNLLPDIVAPGVNIISTYLNNSFNTVTGTGVSSSIVSAVVASMIQFIKNQTSFYRLSIFSEPIKTYLMLGTTQKDIYTYPNISYGYGVLNYENTLQNISKNL